MKFDLMVDTAKKTAAIMLKPENETDKIKIESLQKISTKVKKFRFLTNSSEKDYLFSIR